MLNELETKGNNQLWTIAATKKILTLEDYEEPRRIWGSECGEC
jgi:hypothetical protein